MRHRVVSPRFLRLRREGAVALEEKRITVDRHVVDIFRGEQFRPGFLALESQGVVPVLVHAGS